MQYRLDKISGNRLSALGFGCMRFPRNAGRIDMKKTESLIMDALTRGVNYFDTAYIYPGSEEALGAILEKNSVRDKAFIASKLPLIVIKSAADFDKFFTKELERLRTDYIDYYLMHMLTNKAQWDKLCAWGIEAWISEKKRSDKIRQIGFSFHGSQPEFLQILDAFPWEFCQIQYNYSDENFQAGKIGLKAAAAKGIPVIIMEPLLGGKLATGLPEEAVKIFKKANPSLSPAGWALKWVWNHEEATIALSGMNTQAQLDDNITVAETATPGCLDEAELAVFADARAVLNASYKIHCTGCNYCMPCPKGVNIPGCFAAYNTSFVMGFVQGMKQFVTSTTPTSPQRASPSQCVQCGVCERHCPQHLPIIQNLQLVRKKMEPGWFRILIAVTRRFLKVE
ncbi:MAG: aldo/keto reductase [Treponema sp.]|nr:aldo/keto reductase [Treponema sp.]